MRAAVVLILLSWPNRTRQVLAVPQDRKALLGWIGRRRIGRALAVGGEWR